MRGAAFRVVLAVAMVTASVWPLAACDPEVGATQTVVVEEPLASGPVTDVQLVMGTGKLSITPGAVGLISGTIRCNVADWEPLLSRGDDSLSIKQKSRDSVSDAAGMIVNDWSLMLGRSPMRLKISAGAYEGDIDLSGLTIQELTIEEGASATRVTCNSPNPGQMQHLRYKTGASSVTMLGLANANFKSMDFAGGSGTYVFDFAGQVRTNGTVRIETGQGTVRIQVPATTAAQVTVKGSKTSVVTEGQWVTTGQTHSTSAADAADPGRSLTMIVEVEAGTVTLVTK